MPIIQVELTDDQYARYLAAVRKSRQLTEDPSPQELAIPLQREVAALVYWAEVTEGGASKKDWTFLPVVSQTPAQAAQQVVTQVQEETKARMEQLLAENKPVTAEEVFAKKPSLVWPA